eukprot:Skav213394  [mRNA]  locus=scaffold797:458275:465694:- [translate_table: standard]
MHNSTAVPQLSPVMAPRDLYELDDEADAQALESAMHFGTLFCSHAVDARWNVFDFVIVSAGIVDTWVLPSMNYEAHKASSYWLPVLRLIRVLRFLRIVKLLGVLFRSDLRWTESVAFASVVSGVILGSVVLMGLETDINSRIWEPVNDLVESLENQTCARPQLL